MEEIGQAKSEVGESGRLTDATAFGGNGEGWTDISQRLTEVSIHPQSSPSQL